VTTVGELLAEGRRALAGASFEPLPREAALLLGHLLGRSEAQILARPEAPVTVDEAGRFRALLARRLTGEPFAHLTGEREFYGRPFTVDRRGLVPRPETEHLVEAALDLHLPPSPRILDLGTGTGCLAITLVLELPGARAVATDVSLPALDLLRANLRRHRVAGRVAAVAADLDAGIRLDRFDLVVSNPPYVDPAVADQLSPEVRDFDPPTALFAADAGRAAIHRLLHAAHRLRPGVHLLIEIGHDQAEWLRATVAAAADDDDVRDVELVELRRDYGGILRTAVLRRAIPGPPP